MMDSIDYQCRAYSAVNYAEHSHYDKRAVGPSDIKVGMRTTTYALNQMA